MSKSRKIVYTLVLLVIAALAALFYVILPGLAVKADRDMNLVVAHDPYVISERASRLHNSLFVADLHSDTLLWMRDPIKRHDYGHMDLPRLFEGGVGLQVFSAVTKTPPGLNYETNTPEGDDITTLAIAQRWPISTWNSLYARATYQARRLHDLERRSKGGLVVIRSRQDMRDLTSRRAEGEEVVGGLLATEGAHPLEGDIRNVDRLFDEGYRMFGLQHFFDNELGGSLHGITGDGLTEFGREVVTRMDELEMIIDVAHSSPAVVRDILDMTDRPLVVSHTGIYSACASKRNISDALLAEIAEGGGLIGIGYWADVTCDASPAGIARVIKYGIETFGVEAIALGSDFDGTVTTQIDTSELAAITQSLINLGVSESDIRAVMGGNAARFFSENLPSED